MVAQLEQSRALEANEDLLRRATTDALTGIANRAKFDERLHELVLGLNRQRGDFALLLLDIDHFKKFNDTYGHAVGDIVLREVAQAIHHSLREVDFAARYGGEEFAILAPQTDVQGACVVAARTRKCVENLVVEAEGRKLRVTVSVGLVVTSDYASPATGPQLLRDVDQQLYRAKHAGRNTWAFRNRAAREAAPAAPHSTRTAFAH
jgi:diguanylate cyclase (GGDEF)-like protein